MTTEEKFAKGWKFLPCIGDISCNGRLCWHMPIVIQTPECTDGITTVIWYKCIRCGNYSLKERNPNDSSQRSQ